MAQLGLVPPGFIHRNNPGYSREISYVKQCVEGHYDRWGTGFCISPTLVATMRWAAWRLQNRGGGERWYEEGVEESKRILGIEWESV